MAKKITFTNVQLLGFKRDSDGGRAEFSANLTQAIIKAMEWGEAPECMTKGSLEGELVASVLTLTPADEGLKRHAIDLDVRAVNRFQLVRLELEGSRGKGNRFELRFGAEFADVKGAAKLEAYILTCGKSTASVSYEPQAKQEDLPGVEMDTGCVACNNGIPLAENGKHVSGAKCTASAQASLQ